MLVDNSHGTKLFLQKLASSPSLGSQEPTERGSDIPAVLCFQAKPSGAHRKLLGQGDAGARVVL